MTTATPQLVNFVVVGDIRSGAAIVQSTLDNRGGVTCHADLFHRDVLVRQEAHESRFGVCDDPQNSPTWFVDGLTSPWQYINHIILDRPFGTETALGFMVPYQFVRFYELWELFEKRCREGDFCLIHVERNPVACFVSLKQAERSGQWHRRGNDPPNRPPSPISLDPSELTVFCREHMACRAKLHAACDDALVVSYTDILHDFQPTMRKVFDFVEQPLSPIPARSGFCRLRNRPMAQRISNLAALRTSIPSDVRELLQAEDLC